MSPPASPVFTNLVRLDQQNLSLLLSVRTVLDSARHDEDLTSCSR